MFGEFLIGVLAGLATAGVLQAYSIYKNGGLRKVRVFEPSEGVFNKNFYSYFNKVIESAEDEIVVTGEGFSYRGAEGISYAESYHSSFLRALDKGVHVTRFQTSNSIHPKWALRLAELLEDYPDKFHLYIVKEGDYVELTSVCVVDESRKKNVVEFMLSVEQSVHDTPTRLASTGVFIHGRKELATSLKKGILLLKDSGRIERLTTREEVFEYSHE